MESERIERDSERMGMTPELSHVEIKPDPDMARRRNLELAWNVTVRCADGSIWETRIYEHLHNAKAWAKFWELPVRYEEDGND